MTKFLNGLKFLNGRKENKMTDRIEEIYESLKRVNRGTWRFDESTLMLIIDLGADNILKFRIPDRPIGHFLANSQKNIAFLLETIYQAKEDEIEGLEKIVPGPASA